MRKILIISPHFPPSNLAAVHRSRLLSQHLPSFGWQPIILTVHERYYEEELDSNLLRLLSSGLRIEKVNAFNTTKPRLIGDIGLRAFLQLYKKAKHLIKRETIDFLYVPIPSFYVSLLGRWLHSSTGILYGIDYIDPWVHTFAGSHKQFSRHWWSTKLSSLLEPIAVKKASLITGVAEGYYKGVWDRNPHLQKQALFAAMPYGGEKADHEKINQLSLSPYLFANKQGVLQLVYAGAMLPKAYKPLERIFKTIGINTSIFSNVELHFIGTGYNTTNPNSYNVKSLAEQYGLWQSIVFEYPKRIPYLDVLIHLQSADGVFILGSTEPHYTPSKVYQAVLSQKPIWAILHQESSACKVIKQSGAGVVLEFGGEQEMERISNELSTSFNAFLGFFKSYDFSKVNQEYFNQYSAESVTATLAKKLDQIVT